MSDDRWCGPEDLPCLIEYRCGCVVLTSLPRTPVSYLSSSGKTDVPIVRPTIPIGADAWRLPTEKTWHPLASLPEAWMPYLNRKRGTAMDPRPKTEKQKLDDAIVDEIAD